MLNPETDRSFNLREGERQTRVKETTLMLRKIKRQLVEKGLTTKRAQIHPGWDVHCFFPIRGEPNRIIHFQLYMWPPPDGTVDVRITEKDREKMLKARELGSIGAEENAITKVMLPQKHIVYNEDAIAILAETGILSAMGKSAPKPQPTQIG